MSEKDGHSHDDHGHGHYRPFKPVAHKHGDQCCGHDHHDHHHDEPAPPPPSPPTGLRGISRRASGLYSQHSGKPAALLIAGALLGTTALMTPALSMWMGAGAIMAGSLWLLKKSGDLTLSHTEALGRKSNLSPLALGLGLGAMTAIPEFAVALQSVVQKTSDIGIGTLVGSNIAHVFLVLGATAAIAAIPKGRGLGWKFNTLAMAGTTALFAGQLLTNTMTPAMGWVMAGLTGAYLYGNYRVARRDAAEQNKKITDMIHHHGPGSSCDHDHHDHNHNHAPDTSSRLKDIAYMIGGMAGLIGSSHLVVSSAMASAGNIGISQAAISAVAVSFGTVLPELAINIKAARQKKTELAVGNVLGCNIFNILAVGGAMSFAGVNVSDSFNPASPLGAFNMAALGTSAGLMTSVLLAQKGAMKRWQGLAALAFYGAYALSTPFLKDVPETQKLNPPVTVSVPR